jgi:hypothetical protein
MPSNPVPAILPRPCRFGQICLNCLGYPGGNSLAAERLVGDHHLVNVVAFGALKPAEVETGACRRDASEHHVGVALWAFGAMDLNVEMGEQGMRFWHDASPEGGGSATLPVTGNVPDGVTVMGTSVAIVFRFR